MNYIIVILSLIKESSVQTSRVQTNKSNNT